MKLTFLGGANEVGASCTLLEVAGKRILIDAGIRMGAKEADQLPNLSQIQEGGPLDAILLTHAHTDHIGALPLVHIAYPQIPIFTTAPSKRLTQILLSDALRIMESRWQQEQELPLYPEHTVTAMLAQFQIVEPGQPFAVCSPDLVATFAISGHVMGACSIMLDTPDGRLFHTGDYSLDRQQTVEGMVLPKARPDLVITESTYGNRMHANRQVEEQRLVQCVADVIAHQGKVLIPAFALGRAQEAILLLVEAQRKKKIPSFPIYVDGMVRTVCSAYASFPDFLNRDLRKRMQKIGNPFFHEGAHTIAVQAPQQRQAILDNPEPCCIISSSGMLTGGPSQFYAAALATDSKNAIYITGYQDEESPGRRVLDLADGKSRTIRFGDQEVEVACKVGRYNLSAHADSAQMLGVLSKLGPKDVYLVHGDAGARSSLADAAGNSAKIHLPNNGQSFEHNYKARKFLKVVQEAVGGGAVFDAEQLRQHLGTRFYSIQEMARLWHGDDCTAEQLQLAQAAFDLKPPGYHHSNGLYRRIPDSPTRPKQKRWEQNQALQLVEQLFPGQPDLYRKGVQVAQGELILSFHFPNVALQRYTDRFQKIQEETGWKVSLTPGVHQGALVLAVQSMLPADCTLLKTPSLHLQENRVVAKVHAQDTDFAPIQARFLEATGHQLQIEVSQNSPSPAASQPKLEKKLEINQAFARIRQAFLERKIPLFRCSLKEDSWIELALISPQVAQRHQELRTHLESEVGWPLRFASEPNQDLIKKQVKTAIPSAWGLRKEPAFFKTEGLVQVTLSQPPPAEAFQTLARALEEETGYQLDFKVRP